jgi:hypothetical protein
MVLAGDMVWACQIGAAVMAEMVSILMKYFALF